MKIKKSKIKRLIEQVIREELIEMGKVKETQVKCPKCGAVVYRGKISFIRNGHREDYWRLFDKEGNLHKCKGTGKIAEEEPQTAEQKPPKKCPKCNGTGWINKRPERRGWNFAECPKCK